MFPDLTQYSHIAVDTETTGLKWYDKDRVFGVAISAGTEDYYFDIRKNPAALAWLAETLPKCFIVNHNMKFDIHHLREVGVLLDPSRCRCTMINACLIDEHLMQYSLDFLGKKYLKMSKVSDIYEEMSKTMGGNADRKTQISRLADAPEELVGRYAKMDSRLALELYNWQCLEMQKQSLESVSKLEYDLFPHAIKMERRGVRVDLAKADLAIRNITIEADILQKKLNDIAGFPVNANPSASIHRLFSPERRGENWYACDGTILAETDAGKPSLGKDALLRMKHPAAEVILRLRTYLKCRDTFLKNHVIGHSVGGRVYPNINQTKGERADGGREGTGTGRLSYTEPALQQIPSRDKVIAKIVKGVFLPDEGQGWSTGDLSQHEYRIFAHYVSDSAMLKAYRDNPDIDIHQMVADLTGLPRNASASGGANAKQLNLAMVFSMGAGTLAQHMGLPYTVEKIKFKDEEDEREILKPGEEAVAVFEKYHSMIPGIKEIQRKASAVAKSRGFVKTLYGRHVRFPGGKFTHKASGLIYQSSSADLNKENIIRICEVLGETDSRLMLNIHDSYDISIAPGDEKILIELQRVIQDKPQLKVPIRVDFSKPAATWWDATKEGSYT